MTTIHVPKKPRRVLLLDSPRLTPLRSLTAPFAPEVFGWDDLPRQARKAPPSAVAVIDPFAGEDAAVDARALELIAAAGMVAVVALVPLRERYFEAIQALRRHGLSELADADLENTPDSIRLRLLAVHAQPFKRRLEPRLSRFTSAGARVLLRAAAEVAVDGGNAAALADVLGSGERTAAAWCAREALPPPRRLLARLRVLLALLLMEDSERSVMEAARAVGYTTDYAFRRALRDLVGEGEGTRAWTFDEGMELFNAELRDLRERARRRARGHRAA